MEANRSLLGKFEVAQRHVPVSILPIVGPLLGLGYIVALPFIGIAVFFFASSYRATQRLATMWH